MSMRRIFITAILILVPFFSFASEPNAGFVQGLWYSPEPVFAGVPTRIYVALRNNTEHDLTATIRFIDNGKRIGSSKVSALSGRLVEAWVDWIPTEGEHTIAATASDATLHVIGGDTEYIDIEGLVASSTRTIDTDTDKDGVGNGTDTDDDNDTVSDNDERERGTNPFVPQPLPVSEIEKNVEPIQETPQAKSVADDHNNTEQGLEQYVTNGIADTLLSNATAKIETVKETLDAYRTERSEAQKEEVASEPRVDGGTSTDIATITRTKIDAKNNFLESFIAGVSSLLALVWTFVLFLTSGALGHPALLELALLLGIIYMVYRIARRLGRRPGY